MMKRRSSQGCSLVAATGGLSRAAGFRQTDASYFWNSSRMHLVRIDRDRPDYRVFIDLLFGRGWNVDTEGNSRPVNSRTWTSLYIADRTRGEPPVTLEASDADPQIFQVESASARLEVLAALYLFLCSGSAIVAPEGALDDKQQLALQARYSAELRRAADAVWHQSSDTNPYPNLTAIRR